MNNGNNNISNMIGGGEFILSLPSKFVTFEDTLDDPFRLITCRVTADQLFVAHRANLLTTMNIEPHEIKVETGG